MTSVLRSIFSPNSTIFSFPETTDVIVGAWLVTWIVFQSTALEYFRSEILAIALAVPSAIDSFISIVTLFVNASFVIVLTSPRVGVVETHGLLIFSRFSPISCTFPVALSV